MSALKSREILLKCRAKHFLYAVLSVGFLSHLHVETQPQADAEEQVDARDAIVYLLGVLWTQKAVLRRLTGTALQKLLEGSLSCQSNALWTAEQL